MPRGFSYGAALSMARRLAREQEKQQVMDAAIEALDQYESIIASLTSLHARRSTIPDWEKIAQTPSPSEPKLCHEYEESAYQMYNGYKPNFIDKLLDRVEKRRVALFDKIALGKTHDEDMFNKAMESYEKAHKEWNSKVSLATGILNGDRKSHAAALSDFRPFNEGEFWGEQLIGNLIDSSLLEINLDAHPFEIIPAQKVSIAKTGRVSVKDLRKSELNELYKIHICSCIIRLGLDYFGLLPVDKIQITIHSKLINYATGIASKEPIVSVLLERTIFKELNFDLIDPTACITNFQHNINFKKTVGFMPVEPLKTPHRRK
jgi:hypothetical protein